MRYSLCTNQYQHQYQCPLHEHVAVKAEMSSSKRRRVGATISDAHPDSQDLRSSEALERSLARLAPDLERSLAARAAARTTIEGVVATWVRDVGLSNGLSERQAAEGGSAVLTLGSYALGVSGAGSDIDLVLVVPYFVDRAVAFSSAPGGLLGRLRAADGVEAGSLHAVPDAFVPVVKLVLRGVPVDLLLARLRLPQIPRDVSAETPALLTRCIEDKGRPSRSTGARP